MLDAEKLLDDLYYIKDVLCVGESRLSRLVIQKLLGLLVVPIMVPLMHLDKHTVRHFLTELKFMFANKMFFLDM